MFVRRSRSSRKSASRKHRRTHGQFTHKRKALFEQLEDRRLLAVYASGDVPQAIPDQGTVLSTLQVADNVTIGDLNVTLDIDHTRDKDLDVFLVGPDGTRVELMTDVGGSGNNFVGTILDDEAASSITLGSAPFAGSYQPEGSLSSLDGKSAQGTWTLEVTDDQKRETGTLNSWSIEVTPAGPVVPSISISDISVTEGNTAWGLIDEFVPSDGSFPDRPWDIIRGPSGDFYASTVAFALPSGVKPSSIVRIDADTGVVDADFVPVGTAGLDHARELAISGDWLYVGNQGTNEILRFDLTTGTPDPNGPFVSSGDNGLQTPRGLVFDTAGNLYFSSKDTDQILKYDSAGNFLGFFAPDFPFPIGGRGPFGLAFDSSGDMYVATENRVVKFDGDGNYLSDFVAAGAGGLERAVSLTFGPDGDLYVSNAKFDGTGQILQFDGQGGVFRSVVANSNDSELQGTAFDEAGNLYAAKSTRPGAILRYAQGSTAVFTVNLSGSSSLPVTVNFNTSDGTATVAGSDYTATSGTITFAPGETTKTILVSTIDDAVEESTESFFVNLSAATGAVIQSGQGGQGEATILDDDSAPSMDAIYIYDIRFDSKRGGKDWRAVVEIRSEVDDAPVAGVTVKFDFAGTTYTLVTDSNGIARTSWERNLADGNYYADAYDLALAGFVWNPFLDLEDDSDGDGKPDDLLLV